MCYIERKEGRKTETKEGRKGKEMGSTRPSTGLGERDMGVLGVL